MPYRRFQKKDPRRYFAWLIVKFGRRGTLLILLGSIWVLQGVGVFSAPESSYALLSGWNFPRGVAWIVTGIIGIWAANKRMGDDAVGFISIYIMAGYRVLAYLHEFIRWAWPWGDPGEFRGLFSALAWSTVLVAIIVISGWPEPEPEPEEEPHDLQ